MVAPVVHHDLLGHLVRSDSWLEQGRSSYALAHDAVDAGDFPGAEDYGRITVQEASEAYELYASWLVEIPLVLRTHSVEAGDPAYAPAGDAPLVAPGELDAGWTSYRLLIERFADACADRDVAAAHDLLERARLTWQRHHDRACDTICALFGLAAAARGEAFVGELWDVLLRPMYDRAAQVYRPGTLPWTRSVERLLLDIFEATRGHLTGPRRDGAFTVVEEEHRWVVTFAPCGSGGRTFESGSAAGPAGADAGAPPRALTTEPHDWAWNTVGVCLYCVHCCQLQQRVPIGRLGFPLRVIEPPTADQPRPVCTWSIYKDRDLVPDEAYTRVGFRPPQAAAPDNTTTTQEIE